MDDLTVGDKARVLFDDRDLGDGSDLSELFKRHVGEIGTITYVTSDLISLNFGGYDTIAYWPHEIEKVSDG